MKSPLHKLPIYVLLLPLFFVLHGYFQDFGYIHAGEAWLLAGWYALWSAIVFLILLAFYKNSLKAGAASGLLLGFYFFFGAIHDLLKAHAGPLSKYSVMLPAFLVGSAIILVALKRTRRPLYRLNFFLNLLLVIYLVVDLAGVLVKSLRTGSEKTGRLSCLWQYPFQPLPGLRQTGYLPVTFRRLCQFIRPPGTVSL